MGLSSLDAPSSNLTYEAYPFYIVCDVSESMWNSKTWPIPATTPHAVMQDSIGLLVSDLFRNDVTAAKAHLAVVTFAEEAATHRALAVLSAQGMDPLPKGSWTNYTAVWMHLDQVIRADMKRLQGQYRIKTPIVYFLTDGQPGSKERPNTPYAEWRLGLDSLRDSSFELRPLIVALGMGNAREETLKLIPSTDPEGIAAVGDPGEPAHQLLRSALTGISKSIKSSATRGQFMFDMPLGWRLV